jgi:O-antigen/teichoic acid export membrane protein
MLKSVGSNWAITLVSVVVLYILTPFTLHTLGVEGYGTWVLITSMNGYLGLLVLGVPMASVRYSRSTPPAATRDGSMR